MICHLEIRMKTTTLQPICKEIFICSTQRKLGTTEMTFLPHKIFQFLKRKCRWLYLLEESRKRFHYCLLFLIFKVSLVFLFQKLWSQNQSSFGKVLLLIATLLYKAPLAFHYSFCANWYRVIWNTFFYLQQLTYSSLLDIKEVC